MSYREGEVTKRTWHRIKPSKRIKDLNARPKIIQLLEENMGGKFQDIGFCNYFLDMIPKAQATKIKIDK